MCESGKEVVWGVDAVQAVMWGGERMLLMTTAMDCGEREKDHTYTIVSMQKSPALYRTLLNKHHKNLSLKVYWDNLTFVCCS